LDVRLAVILGQNEELEMRIVDPKREMNVRHHGKTNDFG